MRFLRTLSTTQVGNGEGWGALWARLTVSKGGQKRLAEWLVLTNPNGRSGMLALYQC